ncbi:MAG: hypothetical protein ACLSCD_10205 [Subdoligranulum sp.]
MSGCGTRIVLRGQRPLALCDHCPCFGSLFPPLAALTFAASSIICAFGLASAAPRSPYRHLELCGIALSFKFFPKLLIFFAPKPPHRLPRTAAKGVPGSFYFENSGHWLFSLLAVPNIQDAAGIKKLSAFRCIPAHDGAFSADPFASLSPALLIR